MQATRILLEHHIVYKKKSRFLTHPLVAICTEETRVMAFLHDNISNPRLVIFLETYASLPDSQQLIVQDLHRKIQLDLPSKLT